MAGPPLGLLLFLLLRCRVDPPSASPGATPPCSTPLTTHTAAGYQPEQARGGLPVRLKIPAIKVNAVIEHLGLTAKGAMDAPKGPLDVAWFNLGPRPGEKGSAVIAGHRSWLLNGQVAVFDKLSRLRQGDKLYIETDIGQSVSFVVRETRLYDPEADASEVFLSDNGRHLNLIASAGVWNESKSSATKRLVVFTDLSN